MQSASSQARRGQSGILIASDRSSPAHLAGEDRPSPGKRPKLGHTPTKSSGSAVAGDMYSFSSNVVDLTSSPSSRGAASPQQARVVNVTRTNASSGSTGPKKLVVKNFKSTPRKDPGRYCTQVWAQISKALDTIFAQDEKPFSLEELYRGVENVCRQNEAPRMFDWLQQRCVAHVTTLVEPLRMAVGSGSEIRAVTEAWATWRRQMVCSV